MSEREAVQINAALWRAIKERANAVNVSPEDWLQRQFNQPQATPSSQLGESAGQNDEALYEHTLRHFKDLALTSEQAKTFATAIERTISSGEPQTVSISPNSNRQYTFHRRLLAVSMHAGERRSRLSLHLATRLANALRALHPADVRIT